MSIRLVCTNCKRKVKLSRWHTKVSTRCQACGGMLTGDPTAYYKHAIAHPTRYNGEHPASVKPFVKVAAVAFLFGVVMTAVLFTWHRSTEVPRLMAQLSSSDEAAWRTAMDDLVGLGERAVPALVGAVRDEGKVASERALRTLERLGEDAMDPLLKLLAQEKNGLKASAASVLSQVATERSLPKLRTFFVTTGDPQVRGALLNVFERYPEVQLLRPLIQSLAFPPGDVEREAINARIDRLCRAILQKAAVEHPSGPALTPPAGPEMWPAWLQEHEQEVAALIQASLARAQTEGSQVSP
jgi:hypothetical protein